MCKFCPGSTDKSTNTARPGLSSTDICRECRKVREMHLLADVDKAVEQQAVKWLWDNARKYRTDRLLEQ